jgi:hypothetical protein
LIKIEEFRRYLEIDKSALDDEVVRQPSLFYEVSEAYAEAAAARDQFKEQLAGIDAELDKRFRKDGVKATEGQIKAQIQSYRAHQEAFDDWLDAKETADKLQALKDAFQQRSYMLRDLVSLHNANYFEESSLKTTATQDQVVYHQRRARLRAAREAKK